MLDSGPRASVPRESASLSMVLELAVGGDQALQFLPEMVLRIQFRALLGQPQEDDLQACGQLLAADRLGDKEALSSNSQIGRPR